MAPSPYIEESPTRNGADEVHYTIFLRLPFARKDFADPPPIEWDSSKDKELWDLLSLASSKGRDLDWNDLANRFGVTLAFLSQQAAWLYERQLSQVRAQLRNVNKPSSTGSSPTPGSIVGSRPGGIQAKPRTGSGGGRVPSSLSNRPKDRAPSYGEDGSDSPRTVRGYPISRTTSTTTVTHLQGTPPNTTRSPVDPQRSLAQRRLSRETARSSAEASPRPGRSSLEKASSPSAIASDSSSSSSSDSEALHPMVRSRAFTRRPRYSSSKAPAHPLSDADEEEEEDSPPFLPFSGTSTSAATASATPPPPPRKEAGATVKSPTNKTVFNQPSNLAARTAKTAGEPSKPVGHSSSSSAQSQPRTHRPASQQPSSALSPRQRRAVKEGSDGSPSMGSSFSDLDDASITQSALEEALANEMTHGGVASKMSTISQALKSRYL